MEKGCQEILLQSKDFHRSRKSSQVVAIYKTNKLVLSKKYMSLKTRSSEKVPYTKSSCSRLISYLTQKVVVPDLFPVTN